jgi:hypothetical protein
VFDMGQPQGLKNIIVDGAEEIGTQIGFKD